MAAAPNVNAIQADLNATVQAMGQAPITPIPPGGMPAPEVSATPGATTSGSAARLRKAHTQPEFSVPICEKPKPTPLRLRVVNARL